MSANWGEDPMVILISAGYPAVMNLLLVLLVLLLLFGGGGFYLGGPYIGGGGLGLVLLILPGHLRTGGFGEKLKGRPGRIFKIRRRVIPDNHAPSMLS